jgi:hypothetical protein
MARRRSHERRWKGRDATSRAILRSIAALNPYAGADPAEVERRLRNMNYGATNSRISKVRRAVAETPADQ